MSPLSLPGTWNGIKATLPDYLSPSRLLTQLASLDPTVLCYFSVLFLLFLRPYFTLEIFSSNTSILRTGKVFPGCVSFSKEGFVCLCFYEIEAIQKNISGGTTLCQKIILGTEDMTISEVNRGRKGA